MTDGKYIALSEKNIAALEKNGCRAENWVEVRVAAGFRPDSFFNVAFTGKVEIGRQDGELVLADGSRRKYGIYNASLENVRIGDHCVISNITAGLRNVNIEPGVIIENVGEIICSGASTFGNGHAVEALNEGGGRELKICRDTSAQVAYLSILYRDKKQLIDKLNAIVDDFSVQVKNDRATIGRNSCIRNCLKLHNVHIGVNANLDGVQKLQNGTVDSSAEAPTFIGDAVIAENFIIQKGSMVGGAAILSGCLVGEAAQVGKQVSLENTVLFANCEAFHSELCSVFAGPYTVTHHRSTLLIAGYFSFFNAGSATNQSNHMYKLGPVHQGILERGCKTGSFSYLLWPSRVGAFSAILGKHHANFDTTNLPFSYLNEEDGKSLIIPGMNYFTTGTFRDGLKWPTRDKRKNRDMLDFIHFDILSPYTGQKMQRGQRILLDLYERSEKGQSFVSFKGIHIKRLLLKTCRRYYQLILDKYFGDVLIKRMLASKATVFSDLFASTKNEVVPHDENWIDVCGLLCRQSRMEALITAVSSGELQSFAEIRAALRKIHAAYAEDEWRWFLSNYAHLHGCELAMDSQENVRNLLAQWQKSSLKLLNMVFSDAEKEFEGNVKTGFGIDGNADADFTAVRGVFADNTFKIHLDSEIESVNTKFAQVSRLIDTIKFLSAGNKKD